MDNPAEEMGRAAARMLREMSDGTWNREPILLPTRLIARESC
ncbi:substrate-binding domain-containing protein [Schaalia hyovaginalis]